MTQKTYIVDGRQFRTEQDRKDALQDKELIDSLRKQSSGWKLQQLKELLEKINRGEIHFKSLLGQDFEDELRDRIRKLEREKEKGKTASTARHAAEEKRGASANTGKAPGAGSTRERGQADKRSAAGHSSAQEKPREKRRTPEQERAFQEAVREELEKREKRRKIFLIVSGILAVIFLGIFGIYAYQQQRGRRQNERLGGMIGSPAVSAQKKSEEISFQNGSVSVNRDAEKKTPDVLEEYQTVFRQHKKLIGWLKFDDIDIGGKYGFPVMQTQDNEFFLSHDIEMNSDKNGSIFMDMNCDVLKPSTNFILYGHHMKSGAMFGNLDRYAKQEYWKKYPYIDFDTIYEKGTYQVMYVFRSHVYNEDEIAFKYYQFTDAFSETEFNSYMQEMAGMSLYDTGVTAVFGDQLLTLSTCDYQEEDGRFVVVAKKVDYRQ